MIQILDLSTFSSHGIIEILTRVDQLIKLKHPNIVQILDWDLEYKSNTSFTLSVLSEAFYNDLDHWIEIGRKSGKTVDYYISGYRMAIDISNVLIYLASNNIICKDLYPWKIAITTDGKFKFCVNFLQKILTKEIKVKKEQDFIIYAAPEEMIDGSFKSLTSTDGNNCVSATGIYKFGCVLMAYFCNFKNDIALNSALRNLRENHEIPIELMNYGGKMYDLICAMTSREPLLRPNIEIVNQLIEVIKFNHGK
jgi:hypothetical protein